MVLEKTLERPLDCKEIQPVHSEGDQPWDFFLLPVGKNDSISMSLFHNYFANKGPSSQGYGFSTGHVWM